jgi:hypothetical protein
MDNDFYGAPPAGAIATDWPFIQAVDYSALKTQDRWVNALTPQLLGESQQTCKLGFHYYDKVQQMRIPLTTLRFVLLETFSQVSGATQDTGGRWVNYWSNRIKDTRVNEFAVWSGGGGQPIYKGLYKDIKADLPDGVKFHIHMIAYCIELDGLVDIKMTSTVQRAVQRAVAASVAAVGGGKPKPADKVSLFTLCDDDLLWGFSFKEFIREDAKGEPYQNRGDLYFVPVFGAGTVHPNGKTLELHTKCVHLQREIRAAYSSQMSRYSNQPPAATPAQTAAQPAEPTARQSANPAAYPHQADPNFPDYSSLPPANSAPPVYDDSDLPF